MLAQVGLMLAQVGSNLPHVASILPQVDLKLASSWLKLGPSWLQVGSGRAQNQLREAPGGSPEGSWDGLETLEKVWLTNTSEHDPRPSRQIMLRRLWRRFGSQIHLSMIRGSNDKSCSEDFGLSNRTAGLRITGKMPPENPKSRKAEKCPLNPKSRKAKKPKSKKVS